MRQLLQVEVLVPGIRAIVALVVDVASCSCYDTASCIQEQRRNRNATWKVLILHS